MGTTTLPRSVFRRRLKGAGSAVALLLFGGRAAALSACGGQTESASPDAADAGDENPILVLPPPDQCAPLRLDQTFETDLGGWLALSHNVPGYPKVEKVDGRTGAVLLPGRPLAVDAGDAGPPHGRSGLWRGPGAALPLPFVHGLDLELELYLRCAESCATRVMLAWLDADREDASLLANDNLGFLAGLPDGVGGKAVALDSYLDGGDAQAGAAPARIQIVDVPGATPASTSAVASAGVVMTSGWHSLSVHLAWARGDAGPPLETRMGVSVELNRLPVLRGELPRRAFGGYLGGVTAGTSHASDVVAIRGLHASWPCLAL